jgi:hypothetical protein
MGSGIGALDEFYNTSIAYERGVRTPRTLVKWLLTLLGVQKSITTLRT